MKRYLILLVMLAASYGRDLPLQLAPKSAGAKINPYAGVPDAKQAGAKLFRRTCAECHGQNAEGGRNAPALKSRRVQQAPPGALLWVLRNGSITRGMPSFSDVPEPRLWQIVTYLQSLSDSDSEPRP